MWNKPNKKPQSYHNNTFSSPAGAGRTSSFEEGEVSSAVRTGIRPDTFKEEGEVSGASFSSNPHFVNRGINKNGGNFESHKGTAMNAHSSNDGFNHLYSHPGTNKHRQSYSSRPWGGNNNYSGGFQKTGGVYNATNESPPKYGSYASLSEAGSISTASNPSSNVADGNTGVHHSHPQQQQQQQQHWEPRKRHSFGGSSRGGFDRRRPTGSRPWDGSRAPTTGRGHHGRFDQPFHKQQRNWDRRQSGGGTNDASGRHYYGPPKSSFNEGSFGEGFGTHRSNDYVSDSGSQNLIDKDSEAFSQRHRNDASDGFVEYRSNADHSHQNVSEFTDDFQSNEIGRTVLPANFNSNVTKTHSETAGSNNTGYRDDSSIEPRPPAHFSSEVIARSSPSAQSIDVEDGQIGVPSSYLSSNSPPRKQTISSSSSANVKLAASQQTTGSIASSVASTTESMKQPPLATTTQEQTPLRLACSSLGNDKSIKALKLIEKYPEILSDGTSNIVEKNPDNVFLPTSDQTHNGMLELESKIDSKNKELSDLKASLKNAIKLDAMKKAEIKRKKEEEQVLIQKKLEIDEGKEGEGSFDLAQSDQIIQLQNEIQKLEEKASELNQRIQGKESFIDGDGASLEREIHHEFDSIIATANASVKDAKRRFDANLKAFTDLEEKLRLTKEKGVNGIDLTDVQLEHLEGAQGVGKEVSATLKIVFDQVKDDPVDMNDLVSTILNQNRIIAHNAHQEAVSSLKPDDQTAIFSEPPLLPEDPSDEEMKCYNHYWSQKASEVTGLGDALYVEPSSTPLYQKFKSDHQDMHLMLREYIRDEKLRLFHLWSQLAEEYAVRQQIYTQECGHELKDIHSADMFGGSFSILGQRRGAGGAESSPQPATIAQDTGRSRGTNNPYRRARRSATGFDSGIGGSDIVRSDYEQEQIIAQLTAQALMEKRIKEGRSDLPRQICSLEKKYTAIYRNEMKHRKIHDPIESEKKQRLVNPWTDMEKCIFFDRFLQHPKDFRKIASFLKNKTTHDCISFYYDSKQTVPYKAALKEHLTRKKRKGEGVSWEATIQSAISLGATVTKGVDIDRPLTFSLPTDDNTFHTRYFHPLHIELFDPTLHEVSYDETRTELKKRKSSALENLFQLDPMERKLLKASDTGVMSKRSSYSDLESISSDKLSRQSSQTNLPSSNYKDQEQKKGPGRRRGGAKKWSEEEKESFFDSLEANGRNWDLISEAVETKTPNQVRNFYYDNKKLLDEMKVIKEIPRNEGINTPLNRSGSSSVQDGEQPSGNALNEWRTMAQLSQINHLAGSRGSDISSLGSYFNLPVNAPTLVHDQPWNNLAMQQLLFEQQQHHHHQQQNIDRQRQLEHLAQQHLFSQQTQTFPWVSNQLLSQRNDVLRDMMEGNAINNPQLYFAIRQFQQQYQGDYSGNDFNDFLARMGSQNSNR